LLERTAEGYDGAAPFPGAEPPAATTAGPVPVAVIAPIAGVPFAGIVAAFWLACGNGVGLVDMLADGRPLRGHRAWGRGRFHRCFTHRSFTAAPLLRVIPAIAGSMSFQGSVIGWVATHRRQTAA
jgi:stearoyl-CoA desaturase (Delta-9 desaturase)